MTASGSGPTDHRRLSGLQVLALVVIALILLGLLGLVVGAWTLWIEL